jgi:Fe-S cluster assembly protein SufA
MTLSTNVTPLANKISWEGVKLTKLAARQIINLISKNPNTLGLRLGIKKSGCAGFSYVIDLAQTASGDDLQFTEYGAVVFISPLAMPFIDGTEIDYVQEGLNQLFKFNNPKAKYACGCGDSFDIKQVEHVTR